MPYNRPGTGQTNLNNVPIEILEEFDRLRRGAGIGGKDLTRGEFFITIYNDWKKCKCRISDENLDDAIIWPSKPLQKLVKHDKHHSTKQ